MRANDPAATKGLRAVRFSLGILYFNGLSFYLYLPGIDRFFRIVAMLKGDEAEPTRSPGLSVSLDQDFCNRTELLECAFESFVIKFFTKV